MEDNQTDVPIITAAQNLVHIFFKTLQDITRLAKTEAHLAAKSLVNIIILTIAIRILLIITWLSFCGSLAYFIFYILQNWAIALLIIAGLNLFLVGLACYIIIHQKKNLLFSATRRQLQSTTITEPIDKETYDEYFTAENKLS